MKPDGVATTPAEPLEAVVEPVPEAAANEELVQQDLSQLSTQPGNHENQAKQEGALPPPGKEVNGKFSKPKDKSKAPVKTKPGTAGIKSTTTTGTASRFAAAETRAANGVKKTASVGVNKKPVSMMSEMKKSAPVGAPAQVKKVPAATTVASKTRVKVAEQKVVGSSRPTASTSSVTRKPAAATSQALNNKPAAGGSNASVKSKTTAPRTTTAPATKTSIPDGFKTAAASKTTRSTVATASVAATSSAPVRPKTTTNKSTALRTTVSAPSAAKSASAQPITLAAKKDIGTTNSTAARKPFASTTTRSTAPKAAKPDPPKPAAAAKRLPTDPKTVQQKIIKAQVPTRKVPPSPRNILSRTASGRMAAELGNLKQGGSSNPVSAKVQTAKPTQSVLPFVNIGKPSEEQPSGSVEQSAVMETTAVIAPVESVIEAQALEEGQAEVPALDPTNVDNVSIEEPTDAQPLAIQSVANELVPCEKVHDHLMVVAPTALEMNVQEHVTASTCEVPVTYQMSARDLEVVEKQELIVRNFEEEEEEKEGSQQVSVSDMSGTQPTEESRPGSAGLAGSLWRAGGLPSELDSEDVSCSQHGASELSAPGVLEGTESMDDLGEASLKGADEGASAGSPDFEKFPDIPVNEDEDYDEDRVDDMDVGSEMTEDPHRQCNDDEDEDVEMASEGVTESGLESYGNADEDDLTEDYRLDNLNRMQPSSIVPALSSADVWMQSLQPDPAFVSSSASFPWQSNPELPNQTATEACLDIERTKTDPSSQTSAVVSFPSLEPAAEVGMDQKHDLAPHSQCIFGSDNAGSEHEEEPETLLADDIVSGLSTEISSAPSLNSTSTKDEASDLKGDGQISDPTEPGSKENECLNTQVAQSMSTLVEECEDGCVEMDGGGGCDTPQSATSAPSYGFEGTTSNSNAQSTTESCIKSPGIFSLENEEQLPDETKDQSVVKELSLVPADALVDSNQQGECPLNSEQQYMHCGKVSEELAETTSVRNAEKSLDQSSSLEHQQDLAVDTPHPYYSTICEKTDSFLTGSDLCVPQQEKVPTKQHSALRVDHVMRLPTELPPKMPIVGCNAQLRRLEQHQQQLAEIEQRREQQKLIPEVQNVAKGIKKCNGEKGKEEQECEQRSREEKEEEFEEEGRHLLHLQIQQQQQELKQRQQIMQWQQELEEQTEQSTHQNNHPKNLSTGLLSPTGLCTIYEALETSDAEEENEDGEKEMVLKIKEEQHKGSSEERNILEAHTSSENPDALQSTPPSNYADDQKALTPSVTIDSPPFSETSTSQPLSHLELDWSKKTDIVQQLINQTLLLNGDKCAPHLLIPDGAAGTLSPLKTSLWPNLPQMTPLSATVTSVSSYSAELSGSSPEGEWTVVELETHH